MKIVRECKAESRMNKIGCNRELKSLSVCACLRAGMCARKTDLDNHVSTSSGRVFVRRAATGYKISHSLSRNNGHHITSPSLLVSPFISPPTVSLPSFSLK